MPFLMPNQQHQRTEGIIKINYELILVFTITFTVISSVSINVIQYQLHELAVSSRDVKFVFFLNSNFDS